MTATRSVALAACALLAACGGSSAPPPCSPTAQTGCATGLVCEEVVGANPGCFDPVVVSGAVSDLSTGTTLAGARVVALDASGAPISHVGLSAAGPNPALGSYALSIPMRRNVDGSPDGSTFTLRADRAGYETFPSGLRVALPISSSAAVHASGQWTIATSQTSVSLAPLASPPAGSIPGTVALPASRAGVLLVAEETTSHEGLTAVPGRDGSFVILNVPDGTYELRAYAAGVSYAPVTVTVAGGVASPATSALALAATATATVGGSIQLVSSTAWDLSSVLLVVASTFDPSTVRGAAVPGLKASSVASTWSIAGIPDGHYRVLAAFETDYLVRDPSDIGGTAVLEFQVVGGAPKLMDGTTSAASLQGFKITGAVRLLAPLVAADGTCTSVAAAALPANPANLRPGACTTASATPDFAWETYPATDLYGVTVIDDQGTVAWQADVQKLAGGVTYGDTGASVVATQVAAQPLVAKRTYQVRVVSKKTTGGGSTLSSSEDLLGVFTYVP